MDATSKNVETNMSSSDMLSLVKMQMSDLGSWDIKTQKIEGEGSQDYVASLSRKNKYDVYKPYPESEKKCKENISGIFNPSEAELEKSVGKRGKNFFSNLINHIQGNDKEEELDVQENIGY